MPLWLRPCASLCVCDCRGDARCSLEVPSTPLELVGLPLDARAILDQQWPSPLPGALAFTQGVPAPFCAG